MDDFGIRRIGFYSSSFQEDYISHTDALVLLRNTLTSIQDAILEKTPNLTNIQLEDKMVEVFFTGLSNI